MTYICIGKMINTHGIKGEVKIESYSDFDDDRYKKGNQVYVYFEKEYHPLTVASYRRHKGYPLVSFVNMQNINDVEKYKGSQLYISSQSRKQLQQGEYYRTDLIGLTVVNEDGQTLGKVISVEETLGAQNNLRIALETGKEILIPYIPMIIKNVDLPQQTITIHQIGGLL
ncbi:MAG: ribosome maturation factor RimM [Erysipelotrichaceae bacterium]|nr:ribosome maturation factor RimM [Erysipelotrichaceae bacterium]MDY6035656.1 ribosome maturation factor RimM [Bulleidia sp.]